MCRRSRMRSTWRIAGRKNSFGAASRNRRPRAYLTKSTKPCRWRNGSRDSRENCANALRKKTVKGILADIHMKGPIDALVREMQAEPWTELWKDLGLRLFHFEDVGLTGTSTDLEIWHRCQAEQLIFITNNRN